MKKVLSFLIFTIGLSVHAKITLPEIISDNMVLQQKSTATIWGWTTVTNEKITVIASWNNVEIITEAHQGIWSVQLPTPKAGGPFVLTVKGHEEIHLSNILIGEVWLCSGQSNMEWTPEHGLLNAEQEIKSANYPNIRFFQVLKQKSSYPQDQLQGRWEACNSKTMKKFSSVAYFYGKKLHKDLSVPIGLISSNWGGTPIETWIQKELIEQDIQLQEAAKKLSRFPWWPETPGEAFNAMIHPILKFDIAGVIWYQGESNRVNPVSYYKSFPLLINSWRKEWKKEFPFYFVQIAPFIYNKENPKAIDAAVVRDAQLQTLLTVFNTGMVVTNDIGNLEDIHPENKQDVGKRLALWALAKTYGVQNIEYSGPLYKSMQIKKRKIILSFDHANGLVQKGKTLKGFSIAGADKKFYKAKALIIGNTVTVSSSKVKHPVAVRFAFTDSALPNLYNKAGLPASAFRTDDWGFELE